MLQVDPRQPPEASRRKSPASSRARGKRQRALGHAATCPKLAPGNRALGRASGKSTRFWEPHELAITRRSPRSGPMLPPKHRGSERKFTPDDGLASSLGRKNSESASGQSGKYPKRAHGCRCFESREGKLGARFGSLGNIPEPSPRRSLLRVEHEKTASVLRVMRLRTRSSPRTVLLRENSEVALARAFDN